MADSSPPPRASAAAVTTTAPEPRRPSRLLLGILGTLAALLIFIGICEWRGWPFLRQPLETQLSSKLHRDIRFGDDFRLHLFGSIRLYSDRFSISSASWDKVDAGKTAFLNAEQVQLELPYRSVLGSIRGASEPLDITLLSVGRAEARLRREKDGKANWAFGGASSGATAIPRFEKLLVRDGHLDLQDAALPLQLEATAHTAEGAGEKNPGLTVTAKGRYQDKLFNATAHSPGALPLVAPEGAGIPVTLQLDVKMDRNHLGFDGQATDLLRFGGLSGKFAVDGPSLSSLGDAIGATLPTTAAFKTRGHVSKKKTLWGIALEDFSVGRSQLAGDFRYDTALRRPRLEGELRGTRLALEDLAPALGAPVPGADDAASSSGAAFAKGSAKDSSKDSATNPATNKTTPEKTAGTTGESKSVKKKSSAEKTATTRLLPQREFDIPSLQRMDADVLVNIERVELGRIFALPLQPLQGRLTLDQGELKLDRLLARTADGELRGQLLLDSRREIPLWAANLQWSGVKLEKWLSLRNQFARKSERISVQGKTDRKGDPKTVAPPFISGQLGGQAELHGRGRSTAAMLGTLEGRTQVWIKDGSISQLIIEGLGLDAAQAGLLLVRGDKDISLRCAAVSLAADKGVLNTEAGIIDTSDSLVVLDGQVSLVDEKLALTLRAKPHDLSPLALRAPIHVRGSFAEPKVRPDAGTLGLKIGAAAVLAVVVAPLAALVPLIDPGSSDKGQGCAQTLAALQKKADTPVAMKQALRRKS